jgi:undecaprenyl-diphosphatase
MNLFSHRFRLPSFIQRILDWIGSHELPVLLALLVMALMLWGFVEIAGEVIDGDTARFDEWMLRALRNPNNPAVPIGPQWLGEVTRDLTALGGIAFLTLLTLTISGYLWLRRMYSAMFFLLIAVIGGLLVSTFLKSLFNRPRPDIVTHLSSVYASSFPSGHSMLSATVYLTIGALLARFVSELRFKAYFLIVALVLTGLVGISRVFMGVHYPTDVLAGWVAGLSWAILCWIVARQLQHRGSVEQASGDNNSKIE